jgi:anti-sigma regulatory factor (Ser/Thr protein kinase)
MSEVSISLDSTPVAAAHARAVVRQTYADSLPAATLRDLCLVVSELVTNSWRHGPGGPIRLHLEWNGSGIEGRVEDEGSERFAMGERTDEGGLGLHIVDALTSTWEVAPLGGSVSFVIGA